MPNVSISPYLIDVPTLILIYNVGVIGSLFLAVALIIWSWTSVYRLFFTDGNSSSEDKFTSFDSYKWHSESSEDKTDSFNSNRWFSD